MVLKQNLEKDLKNLNKRFKDLEQSKKKADDENQLLLSFLLNEIGSNDLDNLKELLAGQKLTEILAELDSRKQEIQNLSFDLTITRENVGAQSKDFEEKIKAKQETINTLEEIIKERDEDVRTKQEII
ncbi:13866_t:CDS:1, partial [Funneliformis mosseae]